MNASGSARKLALVALAAAAIALAPASEAFRMIQNFTVGTVSAGALVPCNDPGGFTHWNIRQIEWYHNLSNQGLGKTVALINAMNSWTAVPNADHTLFYGGTTVAGFVTDDRNTLVWANGNGCTGGCLALTALTLEAGQVIVEADVTFNNAVTWTTNGANYDTEAVTAHEFGHTLGIHHTELGSTPRPTMYAFYHGSGGRSLEPDDVAALQCAESRY